MIVPMKKVSLIVREGEKEKALCELRRMGLLHIEIAEGSGEKLSKLKEQAFALEGCALETQDKKGNHSENPQLTKDEALALAEKAASLFDEKKACAAELAMQASELERLKCWGDIDPARLAFLCEKGVDIALYEMSASEYKKLPESIRTVIISKTKSSVRFMRVGLFSDTDEACDALENHRLQLPKMSTDDIKNRIAELSKRISEIDSELESYSAYADSIKAAAASLNKEIEFETYTSGMKKEALSENQDFTVAYLVGYIPAGDLDKLTAKAKENAWGLMAEDPTPDDNTPTKLHNNKFVSLIYPLTDFLGTVPGYFEYDISAWFLGFILVFFGIIFGDGGYGILICAAAGLLILKAWLAKKPIPSAYLLIELMGAATMLWGVLTCTWFGLDPEVLPSWLKVISIPVISNVYADRIWYPFWTDGAAGLTTTQNVQILCFALALIQLSAAHIKGMARNRKSLKLLGDLGAVLQLMGIYYVVLSLVVNGAVFGFGLVIGGIPIGTTAIALVGVGFVMNFVFANYEGSIGKSVLESLKNIVSCLLGVVNVFSDIVSYIRLWAVGLAGAAISATVNELAGPMFGKLVFMIFAIMILVFGHGLNMILNVLSVIVHGVRLNTLEFSTHLDMSWSGHKYKPFEE